MFELLYDIFPATDDNTRSALRASAFIYKQSEGVEVTEGVLARERESP